LLMARVFRLEPHADHRFTTTTKLYTLLQLSTMIHSSRGNQRGTAPTLALCSIAPTVSLALNPQIKSPFGKTNTLEIQRILHDPSANRGKARHRTSPRRHLSKACREHRENCKRSKATIKDLDLASFRNGTRCGWRAATQQGHSSSAPRVTPPVASPRRARPVVVVVHASESWSL